ncbi:MAG: endonuclease III [Bacteroidales bacterium]|nr:endonuclease III [Bacteroidales bacterium]
MTQTELYAYVTDYFQATMPAPKTELHYDNPFQLVVAVRLSAQCTDKRINMVTPKLFERFPDAQSMYNVDFDQLLPYIKSVSYPNSKCKDLLAMARMLVDEFDGEVPTDIENLKKLPGVGPKTANVVASVLYGAAVIPVDTHVFRVSARIGLTRNAKNPLQAEKQLEEGFSDDVKRQAHHWLLLHGRYVCKARKPLCDKCGLREHCEKNNVN